MENENREELAKQVIQAVDSLNKATYNAGGSPFDYTSMVSMSLFEFIWNVAAPNGIRFYLQKPMAAPGEVMNVNESNKAPWR